MQDLSLNEFVFLRWLSLVEGERLGPPQALDSCRFWNSPSPPKLVLFVSHMWETAEDPDPTRRQVHALVRLRNAVALALRCPSEVPSQIVRYLAELMVTLSIEISDVALWYDFACLPQKRQCEKLAEKDLQKRHTLFNLPSLLSKPNVYVVSLRSVGDEYHKRGWCFYESVSGLVHNRHIAWALDDINSSGLVSTDVKRHSKAIRTGDFVYQETGPFLDERSKEYNDVHRATLMQDFVRLVIIYLGDQCVARAIEYSVVVMGAMGIIARKRRSIVEIGLRIFQLQSRNEIEKAEISKQLSRMHNGLGLYRMKFTNVGDRLIICCSLEQCPCDLCVPYIGETWALSSYFAHTS